MKTKTSILLTSFVFSQAVHAQFWGGSDGDWGTGTNWLGSTKPGSGGLDTILVNGHARVTTAEASYHFYLGGSLYGHVGDGTVTIGAGGSLTGYTATYLGYTGKGTIHVESGGSWTQAPNVMTYVGIERGNGTVNVTGGGTVTTSGGTYVGFGSGSTGQVTVSGAGSRWVLAGTSSTALMSVGYLGGTASLTVADGGMVTGTPNRSWLALAGDGNGTLNVGTGGAAGNVEVLEVSSGAGSIAGKVNFNHNETAFTFLSRMTSNLAVEQMGTGTTSLTHANTYSGGTTITGGELRANNTTGSAFGTGAVIVGANTTLAGTGSFTGAATVNGSYAPGNSTGMLTSGSLSFASGSTYEWEMNQADGTVGSTTAGWDFAKVNGQLSFAPGSSLSLVTLGLNQLAGDAVGFNEGSDYLWNIASATGGITGWENLTIDASRFGNDYSGTFGLAVSGNNLQLSYTAVPEPAAFGFAAVAGLAIFCRRSRRRDVVG